MVQFIVQHKVVPAWITSCIFTARIMESYLAVLPCAQFIKHHEVFLKSVDQTLAFDHSNESHGEVFSCVSVHYIPQMVFTTKLFSLVEFSGPHSDIQPAKSSNNSPRTNREITNKMLVI